MNYSLISKTLTRGKFPVYSQVLARYEGLKSVDDTEGEMAHYLIVNSRDLTEYTSGRYIQKVAGALKENGNEVALFLIENGVIAARKGSAAGKELATLSRKGAKIMADDLSCQSRGVMHLEEGISLSNMDHLADMISEGSDKIMWY